MQPTLRLGTALCAVALLLLAASPSHSGATDLAHWAEGRRLQVHFDQVDQELRRRDVQHLTAAQREHRLQLITWLREYRDAGVFPHNDRFPGTAAPFFRDARGVLCAMAYLIERSGRGDLVDRVARTANNAYIPELAADPALQAWLDSTGLSVEEAARIQPSYNGQPLTWAGVRSEYLALSILAGGAGLIASGYNMSKPSSASGTIGIMAGLFSVVVGTRNDASFPDERTVAGVNIGVGIGVAALGAYGLYTAHSRRDAQRSAQVSASQTIRFGPAMIPMGESTRLGIAVQARF